MTAEPIEQDVEPQSRHCLNCDAEVVGRYCHQCGQDIRRGRLVTSHLVSGFFDSLLALDSCYLRTFVGLVQRPGVVARGYVAGKRQSYSNPVAYFVAAMTLNLLSGVVLEFLQSDSPDGVGMWSSSVAAPLGLVVFLPMAALWTWQFRSSGLNLAENYVFTLYVFAQLLLYEILLIPVPLSDDWAIAILFLILTVTFVFAGAVFYRQKAHLVFLKFVASLVMLMVAAVPVAIVIDLLFPTVNP